MNKLSSEDRARILNLLCEGQSIRAVTRLTGVSKITVSKLLVDAGKACATYHDATVRNVKVKRIRVDELWSFICATQTNVATAKAIPDGAENIWTWTAIDMDTKLIVSYFIGNRDHECAAWFINELAARLANRVQLTDDGQKAYLEAVEDAFGADVDYAQLVKLYGGAPESANGRYSPADYMEGKKTPMEGKPDLAHVSNCFVEQQNLTIRMHTLRFTRQTNGFSKKIENHANAVALHTMYYNFVRIHKKLHTSPAMAAGVSDRLWEVADIVALVEDGEAKMTIKRGPYKKISAEISS